MNCQENISASLPNWQEHHAIELNKKSQDFFVIKDLKELDFHLISFSHDLFNPTNTLNIKLSVRPSENCSTNFTIYLTGNICIAIINLNTLQVIAGQAKEQHDILKITQRADGWIDLFIKILLPHESPLYLGCALGDQPIYQGFGENQFYIENNISIKVIPIFNLQYFQEVKSLVQNGNLAEAITLYHNEVEKSLSDEEIYQIIWNSLNKLGNLPPHLVENKKINKDHAIQYFEQNSQYKILNLLDIHSQLNSLFKIPKLSSEYLKIIFDSYPAWEETCIKINENLPNFQFTRKQKRKRNFKWNYLNQDLDFQQGLAETGYLYTICPFQGKILKSNQSFLPIQHLPHIIVYRFESVEVFYLIIGHWGGVKLYLYFPNQELIIYKEESSLQIPAAPIINFLKGNFVSNYSLVAQYISPHNSDRKLVAITGVIQNLGHFWWHNLSGIEYLLNNQLLSNVDKILLGPHCYLDINLVFPEIDQSKFISLPDHTDNIFSFCLENNYVVGYFTNMYITPELVERIRQTSFEQVTPEFMLQIEEAKQYFPLIWINLRSHNKSWVSQVPGYIDIINQLVKIYPNLALVFDGYADEQNNMQKIKDNISNNIKTYNALECRVCESVVWSQAVDTYIAVIGSGLTLVTWIANKVGVAHGEYGHLAQMKWWKQVQPESILPVCVPHKYITNVNPSYPFNYECDSSMVYKLLVKVLKNIPARSQTIQTIQSYHLVSIVNKIPSDCDLFWGYNIETPITDEIITDQEINVSGWILGKSPIKEIHFYTRKKLIEKVIINQLRPDVLALFPQVLNTEKSGFSAQIKVDQIDKEPLKLMAIFADNSQIEIAHIKLS